MTYAVSSAIGVAALIMPGKRALLREVAEAVFQPSGPANAKSHGEIINTHCQMIVKKRLQLAGCICHSVCVLR